MVLVKIYRKYRVKLSKNKQKSKKNHFFRQKKFVLAQKRAQNRIFFVILRTKTRKRENESFS